ncbi:DNA-binding CsgD family transcriptional regulator [Rhizobium sp. SG_E_25_P2]|jgi:DNA-binding CsgD family transcriptional regulator|uniref:helix-turn-helix transcriptional regulator n=1 Tax=Rhizobium sp. SG_E_25_P2 TaxID=2879942 RepID=UPI002476C703|nr:LuxR C-terminal-related transcriptional regulator [Rhizobium sp. SG_E_25_P2]MDH6264788.1 DNA-binding CsgD family transcriptional regulator [Rhizobium sp. SG_E_25_P2]
MSSQISAYSKRSMPDLNDAELSILRLAANGYNSSRIAKETGIEIEGVKSAMQSAQIKLGATNGLQAVSIAIRCGYIGMERR